MKGETLFLIAGIGVLVYLWTRPTPLSGVNTLEQPPTLLPALNPQSPSYDPKASYQYLSQFPRPIPQ